MTIGERIKAARKAKKLTQKQLGELCGINEANIRKYESNRQKPKIETLAKIARALETDPYYLRGDSPPVIDEFDRKVVRAVEMAAKYIRPRSQPIESDGSLDSLDFGSTPLQRVAIAFDYLNEDGMNVAADRVEELMEIPKYQRKPGDEEDE